MSDENKATEILKGFQELLKIPEARRKIAKHLDGDEVKGIRPYYTEKEAKELIPVIDQMIEDKEDREFRYEDFIAYWKPNTVWIKLNQALKYIVDNLDTPDKKYRAFRDCIQVRRTANGVVFHWVSDIAHTNRSWVAHKIDQEKLLEYKKRVIDFLENSKEGDFIHLQELSLLPDEIEAMNNLFINNPYYMAKISPHEIKIVHIKEDPAGL